SPPLYPDGDITDEPDDIMIAELIREAALEDVFDELPHSLAVVVTEMQQRDSDGTAALTDIYAEIYVERDSQKGIIIGKGGAQLGSVHGKIFSDCWAPRSTWIWSSRLLKTGSVTQNI